MNNYTRRNYVLLFADMTIFVNAMTFLSVNTVIPYFLNSLGASTLQISLASTLVSLGALVSQPIFAKKAIESSNKLITFVKILNVQRLLFLGFVFTIPMFASSSPGLMVIVFLIFWGMFNFFTGSYAPFYFTLFSKMVPDNLRGRLIGFGGASANIVALGAAYVLGVLLKDIAFPLNCTLIFGFGILLLLLDNLDFYLMKEPPDAQASEPISLFKYAKAVPEILRTNKKFARLIAVYTFFVVSNISLLYYSLYAIRRFNAKAGEIAIFTIISVIVNIVGGASFGLLADKRGHRLVLKIAAIFGVLGGALVICIYSIFAVYAAFALSSICACGYFLSSGVLIMQNSPQEQIPVYTGIATIITLVVSSIVTMLSGVIINEFSFAPVFAITGAAALCAFFITKRKN